MADQGRAKKVVVRKVIEDSNIFSRNIKDALKYIVNTTEELKQYWDDPQYAEFEKYIADMARELYDGLKEFDKSVDSLTKKYKSLFGNI